VARRTGGRRMKAPETINELRDSLSSERYLVDEGLATVVFLALRIRRPLLVEGEPGVGKTELAKALAAATEVPLMRLQCYEGIDIHHALYDWDYQRQLLHLRAEGSQPLYSERFLLRRPLLEALSNPGCVLLIDELDRADDEFEAFLLEFLSDFQVTIPEIGTVSAERPPIVVITSNRTRELHDALRRRCLYHWIEHPDLGRETAIVRARLPQVPEALAAQACAFVEQLRWLDLYRVPGVGETLDWMESLTALGAPEVEPVVTERSLGSLLKAHEDIERVRREGIAALIDRAGGNGPGAGGRHREAA
jgi:MoxR-like ATPase